ncbi:MAG TPA: hypothetical protein VN962_17040, partial [Polyangia bacterium]|nr:hypothetical protein [Polyangia bacterium]
MATTTSAARATLRGTDTVAAARVQQLLQLALGPLEARRIHVARQHRPREVERHHQVQAPLLGQPRPPTCLRP